MTVPPDATRSPATIAELLAAAEPTGSRPLGELIERLAAGSALHGARDGGRAIGPAALAGIPIRGVTDDSRSVRPGTLFVAIRGLHLDGHEYVTQAAASGAAAALVEQPIPTVALPQLVVDAGPAALADAAAWWYGECGHEI